MDKCLKCNRPSIGIIRGTGYRRCVIHYRLAQMIATAKQYHKSMPEYEYLEFLLLSMNDNMICLACGCKMNWLEKDGVKTVVTLQHDHNGEIRLICKSCNARHAYYKNDSFYDLPRFSKRCPGCKQILPVRDFHKHNTDSTWEGYAPYCKECQGKKWREWYRLNRAGYNAMKRQQYHNKNKSVEALCNPQK